MDDNPLHKIIADLTKNLTENTGELPSKSFVFLDAKTINLLLLYILMNKDLQLTRLTNRNIPTVIQKTIVEEIERMMKENQQSFEEILKEVRNNY
ncbi:hypothetical protein [Sporosarcina koreensis]|uniref:hypothetical protein n=1 Tax=Sporosarcina koreensis TaxID=334735 RepID=UPI0007576132|nr:hypothetical protein [Sporosarcina koreensis]